MKIRRFMAILLCAAVVTVSIAGLAKAADQDAKPDKLLRHVALFKFKESATPEDIRAATTAFAALQGKIKVIQSYEWGTDISPEHKPDGYTHCLVVSFKSEADRDAFIADPARKEFAGVISKLLTRSMVFDYWAQQ